MATMANIKATFTNMAFLRRRRASGLNLSLQLWTARSNSRADCGLWFWICSEHRFQQRDDLARDVQAFELFQWQLSDLPRADFLHGASDKWRPAGKQIPKRNA